MKDEMDLEEFESLSTKRDMAQKVKWDEVLDGVRGKIVAMAAFIEDVSSEYGVSSVAVRRKIYRLKDNGEVEIKYDAGGRAYVKFKEE